MKIDIEIDKLKQEITKLKNKKSNKWFEYVKVHNTFTGGQRTIETKEKKG